jgi:DNA replication and repair protein RecF
VKILSLSLRYFRCIAALDYTFPACPTIVFQGLNGQGKTSLLEALFFITCGLSFRTHRLEQLLQWGAQEAKLDAQIQTQTGMVYDLNMSIGHQHKRSIWLNQRKLTKRSDLIQHFYAVVFTAKHLELLSGHSEHRRNFLDKTCASGNTAFIAALTQYNRILRSRNALLKQHKLHHNPNLQQWLATYDNQLVHWGALVHQERIYFMRALTEIFSIACVKLGLAGLNLGIEGISGIPQMPFDVSLTDYKIAFTQALQQSRQQDQIRGSTSHGPHRGDLLFYINTPKHLAKDYASRGEQRAIVLALKYAELCYVKQRLNTPPLLLLDDLASDWDTQRLREFIKITTKEVEQTCITHSQENWNHTKDASILNIIQGQIIPE